MLRRRWRRRSRLSAVRWDRSTPHSAALAASRSLSSAARCSRRSLSWVDKSVERFRVSSPPTTSSPSALFDRSGGRRVGPRWVRAGFSKLAIVSLRAGFQSLSRLAANSSRRLLRSLRDVSVPEPSSPRGDADTESSLARRARDLPKPSAAIDPSALLFLTFHTRTICHDRCIHNLWRTFRSRPAPTLATILATRRHCNLISSAVLVLVLELVQR